MKGRRRSPAQLRRSQVVTTFGPGALLDLPHHAVIIGGLEHWSGVTEEVVEDRLVGKLRQELKLADLHLRRPPVDAEHAHEATNGITAWQFPEWFVAQPEEGQGDVGRRRRLLRQRDLVNGRYFGPDRRKHRVVPVRFVQACSNGHVSDLDWVWFAHHGQAGCARDLYLEERGTSGDLADVFVSCACGARESLARATQMKDMPLGYCQGRRPWLGPGSREDCGAGKPLPNRLLIRTASNAYFPQTVSVISIPDRDAQLREAIQLVWVNHLQYAETEQDVARERRRAHVAAALEGLSDADVWAEVARRKQGPAVATTKSIKLAELETLLAAPADAGDDIPDAEYLAARIDVPETPSALVAVIDSIVLVHRLREVRAQVGFTRFEPSQSTMDGDLDLGVRRAELASNVSWLPAIDLRGEGFLLTLKREAIVEWMARPGVKKRGQELLQGHDAWLEAHPGSKAKFPGLEYVLLHSLSHLLITAVALECGYAASSINERIYANEAGFGILLYTGGADSEGTLGGLVRVGRELVRHLEQALALGGLCSNDPHCSQHAPDDRHEERFQHGAACHGCVLIAETSCERWNGWLDRSLVIPTVSRHDAAFFQSVGP